jgi:hypothetical protein
MFTQLETESFLRKKIIILILVILVPLVILEIWAVNRLSTYGEKISSFVSAKQSLELENQVLRNQIAEKSSLQYVNEEASNLGFGRNTKAEYINQSDLALGH